MSIRNRNGLISDITNFIPDNVSGLVSPEDVRIVLTNMVDSSLMSQDSGSITASYIATASWVANTFPLALSGSTIYSVSPSIGGTFATVNSFIVGERAGLSSQLTNNVIFIGSGSGQNASFAHTSIFLGKNAGAFASSANNSIFLGEWAGYNGGSSHNSVFIGSQAGSLLENARYSNFIGYFTGYSASRAFRSTFIGYLAGYQATDSYDSVFIGSSAGSGNARAENSVFIGNSAGGGSSSYSNFIGYNSGQGAIKSSLSNFLGYFAGGYSVSSSYSVYIGRYAGASNGDNPLNSPGQNNIIIGTNVSLPVNRVDSINIGGILFGTGSNFNSGGTINTGSVVNGKIGINVVTPLYNFDVSGSGNFSNGLTVTGSISGSLYGPVAIPVTGSAPVVFFTGSMYYNATNNFLYIFNGAAWRSSSFS